MVMYRRFRPFPWVAGLEEPELLDATWSFRRSTRTLRHRCHGGEVFNEFIADDFRCTGCRDELPRYLHFVVKAAAVA